MISSRPARLRAGALAAAVALSGLGLATSAAGAAEPGDTPTTPAPTPTNLCPAAYTGTLTTGQKVTGLTTTQGTTPDEFTGTYVDTVEDVTDDNGNELILVRVEGSRFTKADGSKDLGGWPGMSGSPVYAADGSLVGAISYFVDDTGPIIVGVTPAADLYAVGSSTDATPQRVSVRSARRALARAGAADASTARRLDTPLEVSGFGGSQFGLASSIAKRGGLDAAHLVRAATGSGPSFTGSAADLVPGGALGIKFSTGDISFGGAGTLTARCGDGVYALGHSIDWAGDTISATLHPFRVALVAGEDSYYNGIVGNAGTAVGSFTQDRNAGIFGRIGALPAVTQVSSSTTLGDVKHLGASQVSQPEYLSSVVAGQVVRDYLQTRDAALGGTNALKWTIEYTRAGKAETYTQSNVYASRDIEELADMMITDVAGDVETILDNDYEPVTITSVKIDSVLDKDLRATKIAAVQVLNRNGWQTISSRKVLQVSRKHTLRVRVKLVPASRFSISTARTVNLPYIQPTRSTQAAGVLDVSGLTDDEYYLDDDFFGDFEDDSEFGEDLADASSFKDLLAVLKAQSSNDSVTATLLYATPRGSDREATTTRKTGAVVTGGITVPVRFSG